MLGNYLQQTTFSDAFFSWRVKGFDDVAGGHQFCLEIDENFILWLTVFHVQKSRFLMSKDFFVFP